MENVKGSSVEAKRFENSAFAPTNPSATAHGLNLVAAGQAVMLCQRVHTLRPELLLNVDVCGLEPLVYRDTGDVAEVGFGRHADLRLPTSATTDDAIEKVKYFARLELPSTAIVSVKNSESADIAALGRHWQPRVHAAFSFTPTNPRSERHLASLWSAFGGSYALIPTLSYVQVRGSSYLCHLLTPAANNGTLDARLKQALERLHDAERSLAELGQRSVPTSTRVHSTQPSLFNETTKPVWAGHIQQAVQAIAEGKLEKVVAARFAEHLVEQSVSLVSVLYALGNTHPDSTKFAFRAPGATFLGATPEHLISKFGQTLTTEALAGTAASSEESAQSFTPKEYHEHTPVLDAILSNLAPFCSDLTHEVTPVPLRLPHVLHLRTAISGSLTSPHTHVLDLVQALHPTPAVAGAPRIAALEWLAEHEDFERGWYAGPVGWFDGDGNGQFDVALRCGVLMPDRAVLFAGAGIVEGSIPEQEFAETVLKLKAMQTALSTPPPHNVEPDEA